VIVRAGDLLFVPAGVPHAVLNLEDSVAISVNFLEPSHAENVQAALEELRVEGLSELAGRVRAAYHHHHQQQQQQRGGASGEPGFVRWDKYKHGSR